MNRLVEIESLQLFDPLKNLSILEDFSITLNEGKIHALVGASGSGKSSLAFAILNLLPLGFKLTHSKFELFSNQFHLIEDWTSIRRSEIVYIPQNPVNSFHPYLKLKTQIRDFFIEKKLKYEESKIFSYLSDFGVKDLKIKLELSPFSLSGGERQRVLIAISSLIQPKLLIADEPTTALDSIHERVVLKDLLRINQEKNIAVLLITHDRRIVRELADEVTVLKTGKRMDHFYLNSERFPEAISEYSKKLLLEKTN